MYNSFNAIYCEYDVIRSSNTNALKLPSCCADKLLKECGRVDFSWGYSFHYAEIRNPSFKPTRCFQLYNNPLLPLIWIIIFNP